MEANDTKLGTGEEASGAQLWRLNTLGLLTQAITRQLAADFDAVTEVIGSTPEPPEPGPVVVTYGVASAVLTEAQESGVWQLLI